MLFWYSTVTYKDLQNFEGQTVTIFQLSLSGVIFRITGPLKLGSDKTFRQFIDRIAGIIDTTKTKC